MRFYYFNSTHWDREWYATREEFRYLLVQNTKRILQCLERPGYGHFVFDGQTVVLEDVAEVRPDLASRLREVVSSGRLRVGPWYVMPDELLASGESLIRNLQTGRRLAQQFGAEAWPVAYVCDIFGHIAQLPQIGAGFGLAGIIVWRGLDRHKVLGQAARWQAPDGTQLPLLALPHRRGYSDFYLSFRKKLADETDTAAYAAAFESYLQGRKAENPFPEDFLFMSDAMDHSSPLEKLPELLDGLRRQFPAAEVIHTDCLDFFRRECTEATPLISGEQCHPARTYGGRTLSGTLSSRYDLKRRNDLCHNLVELLVEPEAAARAYCGDVEDLPFLQLLWKTLLQNTAHDSICGCSIAAVHRRMTARFDDGEAVGRVLASAFCEDRRRKLAPPATPAEDGTYLLQVYNPLPYDFAGSVTLHVEIPTEPPFPGRHPAPNAEPINHFRLNNADGTAIAYQTLDIHRARRCRRLGLNLSLVDSHTVVTRLKLPAAAWTTLRLEPDNDFGQPPSTLRTGPQTAQNGLVKMQVTPGGALTLTDLRSGRDYPAINTFVVDRDVGDGWFCHPPIGLPERTRWSVRDVRVVTDGPERVTFAIEHVLQLPERLDYAANNNAQFSVIRESDQNAELVLHLTVSLDRDSDLLPFHIRLENHARDFRLRWLIPTGIHGPAFASQAFALISRPAQLAPELTRVFESEAIEKNFDGMLGKRDDRGGLALLSRAGLHAGGPRDDEPQSLSVILLRAFMRTIFTQGESDGELSGSQEFDGTLALFPTERTPAELFRALQGCRVELPHFLAAGEPPAAEASWLRVTGEVVVSALKPADDATPGLALLRLFNPDAQKRTFTVQGYWATAVQCRLDETGDTPLASDGHTLNGEIAPGAILTLKFRRSVPADLTRQSDKCE